MNTGASLAMTDFERQLPPHHAPITYHRSIFAVLWFWLNVTVWSMFTVWIILLIIQLAFPDIYFND